MKKLKPILFLFSLLTLYASNAQNELMGSWTVSCPIERLNENTGNVCDLCPANFDKKNKEVSIEDMELKFEQKTVFIKTTTDLRTTFYTWDDLMRVLEFKYNDKRYVFKILVLKNKNYLILKEAEGSVVVMVRKN